MVSRFFRLPLLLLTLLGMSLSVTAFAARGLEVSAVRLGQHETKTRFVRDLSAGRTCDVFLLADPYRLVIDLPDLPWRAGDTSLHRKGVVRNFRWGLFKKGTSRV